MFLLEAATIGYEQHGKDAAAKATIKQQQSNNNTASSLTFFTTTRRLGGMSGNQSEASGYDGYSPAIKRQLDNRQ